MNRQHRIGIDIDTKNQFELLKKYFNSRRFGECETYETLHGFHIHIFVPYRDSEHNMLVRYIIGDCQNRMELDEARLRFGFDGLIDTLFEYKKVHGVVSREEPFNILSLPFWGMGKQWRK